MEIRKCIVLLIAMQISLLGYSQTQVQSRDVKRISGKAYLQSKGNLFEIREDAVLAQLKARKEQVSNDVKVLKVHSLGMLEIAVPDSIAVEEYVKVLDRTGDFEYVEFDTYLVPCMSVNDTQYSNQWGISHIHADVAWDITTGAPSVKVAVIDNDGFDLNHPDLYYGSDTYSNLSVSDYVSYVSPTDTTSKYVHGTRVAGIIAAKTNNGIGIAGIAGGNHSEGAKIIPYHAMTNSHVISAINNAISKGVKIINMSFITAESSSFNQAITNAYSNGVTMVCSTGRDGLSSIPYPASHEKTIAVGAVSADDLKASFSDYGEGIDLVAPGYNITSTVPVDSGYYKSDHGTSFAAPFVSGVVALMLSVSPNLTPNIIRDILRETATKVNSGLYYDYDSNGWNQYVGYGLVNALAAVYAATYPKIIGNHLISSTQSYSIDNVPTCCSVAWSLSNSYYNQNCLQQNYPSTNQCTITRSDLQNMMDATLTAYIIYNGDTIRTLNKSGIYAYSDFWGHYTSDNLSGDINYTHYFNVKPNTSTYVFSPNLYGGTVSFNNIGTIPTYWSFYSDLGRLYFTMPTNNNNIPIVINVNDGCGNFYLLYAAPQNYKNLNISVSDQTVNITIGGNSDITEDMDIVQPWTLEVRSATTGELKTLRSETSKSASDRKSVV